MAQGDNIIIDVLGNTKPLEKNIARVANQALTLNTKGFSQPLGKISGQLGEFEKSLAASNARVIAFGASAGAIYAVQRAFSETIRTVIEVEKALTDINVILNVSEKSLNKFGAQLFNIAKNTGLSFAEVAKSAVEFSRQGLSLEDTLKRTSDALILTRLSGLDTVSSVEALTAAINSFSSSALTSTEIVNKLAAVDAAFAVSSADLAEAIKRVGSSAVDAGVSFDQLIALVTSAQQITSRGGSVIGNSFKTIFTRLQRPKTLDALEEIGVATRDQEGNILPLLQILGQLANQYENLSSVQRAQVAETVGGVFQINILKAALGDLSKEYSIYSRAVSISSSATDEANRRNQELNNTLAATVNKTVVNLQSAATEIGNLAFAPALRRALEGLNYVLENFGTQNTEDIGSKIGKGIATGLGNFLSGPGLLLGAASLIKIFERLTVFTADAFRQITGLNSQTTEQKALQAQILNLIGRNPQIIDQINRGNLNTTALHKQILTLIEQETIAMQRQLAVANSLTQTLMGAGVRIPTSGPLKGAAVKTKYSGFIPNFSANQEIMGALAGGYVPGKVKQTFIPNYGKVTYNSAEIIKRFSGMSQPAIMPPSDSSAGKSYKKNFEAAHGFNPYANRGFIPNFATKTEQQYRFRKLLKRGYEQLGGEEARIAGLERNKNLLLDGTTVLDSGEIFIKKDKKNIITSQLRATEKSAAQARGQKEGGKTRSKSVFIYPDIEGGKVFQSGGKASDGTYYKFPIFPFPGGNKQVPDLLYENVSRSLVDVAKDYISGITTRPNIIKSDLFESYVRSNLSRSAIEASTGQVFESAIKSSINRVATSEIDNMDLDTTEIKAIASRFKGKNSLSKPNLDSFANKLLYKDTKRKTSKFNGFIPNFSPIKKAMEAEKMLGGNPVLDYEAGLGLYVRDGKTQPNFASVKRDHPEGIKNAINNSFAFQRQKAFGFIPNFQAVKTLPARDAKGRFIKTTPDTSLGKASEEAADSISDLASEAKQSKNNLQTFREKALYASFAVSLIGGFASEFASDNKILSNNINTFVQGLGTAATAIGLIPGPIGLVAGAATTLYATASFISKSLRDNGEEISKNLERAKQETAEFNSSTQKYSDVLQKLNDAYGDSKTSVDTIIKLNKELQVAARDLPAEYRLQLLSITNGTKLQETINEVQAKKARAEKTLTFASEANAKLASGAFGYGNVFGGGGLSATSSAKDFINNLENMDVFLSKLNSSLLNLEKPQLINFFKELGVSNQDLLSVFSRMNLDDIEDFKYAIYLIGQQMQDSKREIEAITPIREAEAKKLIQTQKETLRARQALDNLTIALDNLIDTAIKSETFKQNFGLTQAANLREVGLSRAEGLVNLNEPFSSPESVNRARFDIERLMRRENLSTQIREIQSSSRQSMLESAANFAAELSRPKDGEESVLSSKDLREFNIRLLDIAKENLAPSDTEKAISNEISKLNLTSDRSIQLQQKLSDISREQNQKIASIAEEGKKSNLIAKNNLDIQQRILQSRRDIETAGGIQGFLDPEYFSRTNENFQRYRTMYRGGERIDAGRGAAGLLSEIVKFAGGGVRPELLPSLKGLKSRAITGRAADIKSQAEFFARQTPGGGAIFRDISRRSKDIATTQIESLIKDQNIGQNVEEITQILRGIEKQQTQSFVGNLDSAINYAIQSIQSNLLPSIDNLSKNLQISSEEYALRQEREKAAETYGKETTQRALASEQAINATKRINELKPILEKEILGARGAAKVIPGTNIPTAALIGVPRKAGVFEQGRAEALGALQAGAPINIERFAQRGYGSEDLQNLINLIKEYNTQIEKRSGSESAFESGESRLDEAERRIDTIDTQIRSQIPFERRSGTMIDLANQTQRVTPQIAPTPSPNFLSNAFQALRAPNNLINQTQQAPQKYDVGGTVQVEKPDSPLDLNVGGQISFQEPTFTVKIDPASDLTSAVTPVVQDFLTKTQEALNEKFKSELDSLKDQIVQLGGQRKAPEGTALRQITPSQVRNINNNIQEDVRAGRLRQTGPYSYSPVN
jgi:TP901 family phage tail tape measure protein